MVIDLDQFHPHGITGLTDILDPFGAFPIHFRNVHQTFFTWHNLYKSAKGHHSGYDTVKFHTHFRFQGHCFHDFGCFFQSDLVHTGNGHCTIVIHVYITFRISNDFLDGLSTWSDQSANFFRIDT